MRVYPRNPRDPYYPWVSLADSTDGADYANKRTGFFVTRYAGLPHQGFTA